MKEIDIKNESAFRIPLLQEEHEHYNVYPKVMGEIRRIAKYAKQGDLSPSLDKP